MLFLFRLSAIAAVVVLVTKSGVFVAEDIGVKDEVVKKVDRLIDEGLRRREEIEEAGDGVFSMAVALAVSVVREIRWASRRARGGMARVFLDVFEDYRSVVAPSLLAMIPVESVVKTGYRHGATRKRRNH